jgi:hypothetical protein
VSARRIALPVLARNAARAAVACEKLTPTDAHSERVSLTQRAGRRCGINCVQRTCCLQAIPGDSKPGGVETLAGVGQKRPKSSQLSFQGIPVGLWVTNWRSGKWLEGNSAFVNATPTGSPPFSELVMAAFRSFLLKRTEQSGTGFSHLAPVGLYSCGGTPCDGRRNPVSRRAFPATDAERFRTHSWG